MNLTFILLHPELTVEALRSKIDRLTTIILWPNKERPLSGTESSFLVHFLAWCPGQWISSLRKLSGVFEKRKAVNSDDCNSQTKALSRSYKYKGISGLTDKVSLRMK